MKSAAIRRFVLLLGALVIGFSGCASSYVNTPVVAEDLILDQKVIVWTNEGTTVQGVVEAAEDSKILLVSPDGRREWIMLEDIRTLKHVGDDRKTPWGVKLALWTLGVYVLLGVLIFASGGLQLAPGS